MATIKINKVIKEEVFIFPCIYCGSEDIKIEEEKDGDYGEYRDDYKGNWEELYKYEIRNKKYSSRKIKCNNSKCYNCFHYPSIYNNDDITMVDLWNKHNNPDKIIERLKVEIKFKESEINRIIKLKK